MGAARVGGVIRLVHAVAVEAAARPGVPGLLISVARGARLRIEGRRAVRVVDVYMRRLRVRIEADPENPDYLKTCRGMGYLFESTSR